MIASPVAVNITSVAHIDFRLGFWLGSYDVDQSFIHHRPIVSVALLVRTWIDPCSLPSPAVTESVGFFFDGR
jgi:hypothetical protein